MLQSSHFMLVDFMPCKYRKMCRWSRKTWKS